MRSILVEAPVVSMSGEVAAIQGRLPEAHRNVEVVRSSESEASTQQPLLVRKPSVGDVQQPVRPQEAPHALEGGDGSGIPTQAFTRRAEAQEARKKIVPVSTQRSELSSAISRLKGELRELAATARPAEDLEPGLAKLAALETKRLRLAEKDHWDRSRIYGIGQAEMKINAEDLGAVSTRYAGEAAAFRDQLETLLRFAREAKAAQSRALEPATEVTSVAPVRAEESVVIPRRAPNKVLSPLEQRNNVTERIKFLEGKLRDQLSDRTRVLTERAMGLLKDELSRLDAEPVVPTEAVRRGLAESVPPVRAVEQTTVAGVLSGPTAREASAAKEERTATRLPVARPAGISFNTAMQRGFSNPSSLTRLKAETAGNSERSKLERMQGSVGVPLAQVGPSAKRSSVKKPSKLSREVVIEPTL